MNVGLVCLDSCSAIVSHTVRFRAIRLHQSTVNRHRSRPSKLKAYNSTKIPPTHRAVDLKSLHNMVRDAIRLKADMSYLNLPHGMNNLKVENYKAKK